MLSVPTVLALVVVMLGHQNYVVESGSACDNLLEGELMRPKRANDVAYVTKDPAQQENWRESVGALVQIAEVKLVHTGTEGPHDRQGASYFCQSLQGNHSPLDIRDSGI